MSSDCVCFVNITRMDKNPSDRIPCRNYITHCNHPNCDYIQWRYNMPLHYADKHPAALISTTDDRRWEKYDHLDDVSSNEIQKVIRSNFVVKS